MRRTFLWFAVSSGNLHLVKQIYEKSPNEIEQPDDEGNTPLHIAVKWQGKDYNKIIDFLLAHGHKIDIENNQGKTPLNLAEETPNESALEKLRNHFSQHNIINHGYIINQGSSNHYYNTGRKTIVSSMALVISIVGAIAKKASKKTALVNLRKPLQLNINNMSSVYSHNPRSIDYHDSLKITPPKFLAISLACLSVGVAIKVFLNFFRKKEETFTLEDLKTNLTAFINDKIISNISNYDSLTNPHDEWHGAMAAAGLNIPDSIIKEIEKLIESIRKQRVTLPNNITSSVDIFINNNENLITQDKNLIQLNKILVGTRINGTLADNRIESSNNRTNNNLIL